MGKSVRRSVGVVAALALVVGYLVVAAVPSGAAGAHGLAINKECVNFTEIGQPYQCRITITNNPAQETALDTLVVDGVTDIVGNAGGPTSSNTVFPGGLLPQFTLAKLGGATCNVGQTQCTLPSGASIVSTFFSWYTTTQADFGLPLHTLVDSYTVAWHDLCDFGGSTGGCNSLGQSNSAGAASTLVDANIQITPATDTNRVGDTHVFTGHVNVSCEPASATCVNGFTNAPDGTQISFTIDSGPGGFTTVNPCTTAGGTGSCQISLVSAATGVTVVSAHTTVSVHGLSLTRNTNGAGANSGPAHKTWVNAKISIVQSATNEVSQSHTFTVTLQKDLGDGAGFVAAANEHVDFTLVDSNFAVHTAPTGTCTGAGANTNAGGQCTIIFTSNSTGQVTGHAFSTLTVGGVSISVATDGVAPNSGDVVKTFVDANIQITPATATNAVNTNHTLTGHVNVDVGDGAGLVNAPDGTTITFSIASGPGSFVGPNSCVTAGGTGSCTVVITSAIAGTTMVHATTTLSVGGVSLTRATGDAHVGDSADASKTWVNANIQITPATATNAVGTNHVLTITVNAINGTLDAGPHTATASIESGPGSFVGSASCTYTGGAATASCTVTISSAAVGTTVVSATANIPVNGQTISRTTNTAVNTAAGGSGNASKDWVDANIVITPASATNPIGTNHVLTITVNALGGTLDAGSHTATASIVSGPGSFVGSPTCTYTGGGATASCTVTITSATTGTTVVSATANIPVNGQSITRTTGTAANITAGGSNNASKDWVGVNVRTDIHDPGHVVVTTVVAGTIVHDKVFVTKAAGTPAALPNPTGNVTFHRYTSNDCTGTSTDETVTLPVSESSPFTVGTIAMSYKASYLGDAIYPPQDGACEPLAITTLAEGRVTGGGSIFATINGVPNVRVTHGFELRCTPNDKRQSLEINWDGGNNFHLDKIINSVICFDDPTTTPPPPPGTAIDTYAGNTLFNGQTGYHGFGYAVGTGTCNKQPATIYFILIDAGEPGTADIAEYHIVSSGCTLNAGPALITNGNHQFHKN